MSVGADAVLGANEVADAEAARRDVRQGKSLFALIVPEDFSASALGAAAPGAGKITVFAASSLSSVMEPPVGTRTVVRARTVASPSPCLRNRM